MRIIKKPIKVSCQLSMAILFVFGSLVSVHSNELSDLMNMSAIPTQTSTLLKRNPRQEAVYNTAYTLGAQKGYLYELHYIQSHIKSKTAEMNRIFDFRSLINLSNTSKTRFIIPPVIQQASNSIKVEDKGNYLTVAGGIYRIVVPAHLATAPPTWQEFLLFGFGQNNVTPINKTMLPKDKIEKGIWDQAVEKGWDAGIKQANIEMINRERKLGLYYDGMALYEKLLMKGVVTKPFVAVSHQNVSGDGTIMNVNEESYRITTPAKLNENSNQWKSIPLGASDEN